MERQEGEVPLELLTLTWATNVWISRRIWLLQAIVCLSPGLGRKKKELTAFENANPIPLPPQLIISCVQVVQIVMLVMLTFLSVSRSVCQPLCAVPPAACPHSTEGSVGFFHATDQKPVVGSLTDISQSRMPKKKKPHKNPLKICLHCPNTPCQGFLTV